MTLPIISTGPSVALGGISVGAGVPVIPTPSGGGGQVRVVGRAAVSLSGHRAVTARTDGTIQYASNATPAHLHAPVWITTGAASAGAVVEAVAYGPLTEPSWAWTPGPIYLGAGGLLTQTPPTSPAALFLAQVAVATGPTSVFVDRRYSISLI